MPAPSSISASAAHAWPTGSWLPDETLFSLCSRLHVFTGARLSDTTTRLLFGHPRIGAMHDFPANLEYFVHATEARFSNSVRHLCHNHTVLGFYLPWISEERQSHILRLAAGAKYGSTKALLGLPAAGFGAQHPLKLCNECVKADQLKFGTGYWHLDHQYPGVWWCCIHNYPLSVYRAEQLDLDKFQWKLPGRHPEAPIASQKESAVEFQARLTQYISTATKALTQDATRIRLNTLHRTYIEALRQEGLIKGQRSISHDSLAHRYLEYLAPLRNNRAFPWLPRTISQCQETLSKLVHTKHTCAHPLRHLMFISWLFADWHTFWCAYIEASKPSVAAAKQARPTSSASTRSEILHRLTVFFEAGCSARATAQRLGVDTNTVMAWAAAAGIVLKHRKLATRQAVITELRLGKPKVLIAETLGISTQTVTRILRSEPGLSGEWHEATQAAQRILARHRWTTLLLDHNGCSITQLRALDPRTYAWLYRNDPKWLREQPYACAAKADTIPRRAAWNVRDLQFAKEVTQTFLTEETAHPNNRVTLKSVFQAVPDLHRYKSKLELLPRTEALLKQIVPQRKHVKEVVLDTRSRR